MPLTECPKCGATRISVEPRYITVHFDGTQLWGFVPVEAYCPRRRCEQRFWYHPKSGRITRRNSGPTKP